MLPVDYVSSIEDEFRSVGKRRHKRNSILPSASQNTPESKLQIVILLLLPIPSGFQIQINHRNGKTKYCTLCQCLMQ